MSEVSSASVGNRIKARTMDVVSSATSRSKPLGRLIVGERDQYVNWSITEVAEDSEGHWPRVIGDPEAGLLRSRWRTAMVLGGVSIEELSQGEGVPAVAIDLGGVVLAGEFDPAVRREKSWPSDRVEVALVVGPDDMKASLGQLLPDGPFRANARTARLDSAFGQGQGVPIADLREGRRFFPDAVLL